MKDMRGLGTALPKRGGGKKAPQEEDEEDDGDYQPTEAERKLIAEALKSNNPALMAALNAKLNSMVGKSSGYLDTLPSKVRPVATAGEKHSDRHPCAPHLGPVSVSRHGYLTSGSAGVTCGWPASAWAPRCCFGEGSQLSCWLLSHLSRAVG